MLKLELFEEIWKLTANFQEDSDFSVGIIVNERSESGYRQAYP